MCCIVGKQNMLRIEGQGLCDSTVYRAGRVAPEREGGEEGSSGDHGGSSDG